MNDVHSAVGSYVADALEVSERAEFEAHLSYCESCRQEVAEFDETTAELARLVATPPPAALRDSVLASIREVRPLPPDEFDDDVTDDPPAPTAIAAMRPSSMRLGPQNRRFSVAPDSPDWDVPVDDLAEKRQWRRTRILTMAVAAAMVVALALGGWVYALVQQREALTAQREAATAAVERERNLLSAPDAKVVVQNAGGARYSFVMSKQRNEALFLGTDLADPGRGKAYQLWTIDAQQKPVPDDMVRGYGRTQKWFSGPVGASTALAVTIEPAEGSQKPTLPILAAAPV